MIDIGPVPRFAGAKSAIEYPIVRDMDTNMYERQDGSGLEVGSYAHRPILYDPEDIPSVEEAALSPTEFPFTQDDFALQMEHALELMPEIVGDESVGIKYAINGLLSLTPDGLPILGETPEVGGLWSAAAVWVKEGPGVGRALAEWMVHGEPEIDLQASDVARFHEHQKSVAHVKARAAEGFNKTYGIVHPGEQWASNRGVRLSPFHERARELGAVFYETAGWERPHWYESNAPLLEEYGESERARGRVGLALVVPDHQRRAPRDARPRGDVRPHRLLRVRRRRPGRARRGAAVAMRQMDVKLGKVVYTPVLTPGGGFRSDLTIMRLGDEHFRVVTGGAHGMADLKWFADHLPADGTRADLRPHLELVHARPLGPARARHPRRAPRAPTCRTRASRSPRCRTIEMGSLRVLASRISYVGDLGWELYVPIEQGAQALGHRRGGGRAARRRARPASASTPPPAGSRSATAPSASSSTASTTWSRPAWPGARSRSRTSSARRRTCASASPSRPRCMCTLTVDDHTASDGRKRYMLGGEPIVTRDGAPLDDAQGAPLVRHERGRRPVRRQAHPHVLPAARARERRRASSPCEYMGERFPVTVAVAGSTPLFDPDNERVKAAGRS